MAELLDRDQCLDEANELLYFRVVGALGDFFELQFRKEAYQQGSGLQSHRRFPDQTPRSHGRSCSSASSARTCSPVPAVAAGG